MAVVTANIYSCSGSLWLANTQITVAGMGRKNTTIRKKYLRRDVLNDV